MQQLGAFEPLEAKRLLPALEAQGVAFELEADHSALGQPGRTMEMFLGMYPEGSKLAVFVRESQLAQAQETVKCVFPV